MLVEVGRKAYLASIVPVIVNAILNEHQIVVDIVAFVNRGDFPRSRLGEKQRGKILAGWVTRKMRTMAQFAIRDTDLAAAMNNDPGATGASGGGGMADDNRVSQGSLRAGVSSLRNMANAPQILEQEEFENQVEQMAALPANVAVAEMPAEHPTRAVNTVAPPLDGNAADPSRPLVPPRLDKHFHDYDLPDFNNFGREDTGPQPPPPPPPKPASRGRDSATPTGSHNAQIRLPGVDGRESLDLWHDEPLDDEEDWTTEAIMHMNLAGDLNRNST